MKIQDENPEDLIRKGDIPRLKEWLNLGWDYENKERLKFFKVAIEAHPDSAEVFLLLRDWALKRDETHGFGKDNPKSINFHEYFATHFKTSSQKDPNISLFSIKLLSQAIISKNNEVLKYLIPEKSEDLDFYYNPPSFRHVNPKVGLFLLAIESDNLFALEFLWSQKVKPDIAFSNVKSDIKSDMAQLPYDMNQYLFRKKDISLKILNFLNSKGFHVHLDTLDVSKKSPHIPLLLSLFKEGMSKRKLNWILEKGLKLDTPITFFTEPKELFNILSDNSVRYGNFFKISKEIVTGPKTLAHWLVLSELLIINTNNLISIFEKENPKIDLEWLGLLREDFSKEDSSLSHLLDSITNLDWIESKLMNYSLPKPSCTTLKINSRL